MGITSGVLQFMNALVIRIALFCIICILFVLTDFWLLNPIGYYHSNDIYVLMYNGVILVVNMGVYVLQFLVHIIH